MKAAPPPIHPDFHRSIEMTAWKWLAVGVLSSTAMAQGPAPAPEPVQAPAARRAVEDVPAPAAASSRVAAATVYQGVALVTREVTAPEGKGTVELVVTQGKRI
ncbi:MAG TPA: hypothetical protein VG406_27340 [Isosphaeraceae bacterium]|nr:hypothetical protein [Isosphaeraceae bacterium]